MDPLLRAVLVAAVAGVGLGVAVAAIAKARHRPRAAAIEQPTSGRAASPRAALVVGMAPTAAGVQAGHMAYVGLLLGQRFAWGNGLDDVLPGSPAARAGLRAGDLVTTMAGIPRFELRYTTNMEKLFGPRGSVLALEVEGRGRLQLVRTLDEATAATAWRRHLDAAIDRRLAAEKAAVVRAKRDLARAVQAVGRPPAWASAAWARHAADARGPLARLAARPGGADAARLGLALAGRRHADVVQHMIGSDDLLPRCVQGDDPRLMALPNDLRKAFQLSALLEAHRLAAAGRLDAAAHLAEQAETATPVGDRQMASSEDDPRYEAAGAAARRAIEAARAAAGGLVAATEDLRRAREVASGPRDSGPPRLPYGAI